MDESERRHYAAIAIAVVVTGSVRMERCESNGARARKDRATAPCAVQRRVDLCWGEANAHYRYKYVGSCMHVHAS